MLLKRTLATACLLLCLALPAWGQSDTDSGVTVTTDPPGAQVTFDGDAVVQGVSPVTFIYPMSGDYRLMVSAPGYETYKTKVFVDPDHPDSLNVSLTRKTPMRAALRSVFLPGWGQWYTEQKGKGTLLAALFVGSVTAYFALDNKFDDKYDTYTHRLNEYDDAVDNGASYAELQSRLDALSAAQDDAYDAESARQISIGLVAGVWGLSLLDALLFTPNERPMVDVKGLSIAPVVSGDQIGLSLSAGF